MLVWSIAALAAPRLPNTGKNLEACRLTQNDTASWLTTDPFAKIFFQTKKTAAASFVLEKAYLDQGVARRTKDPPDSSRDGCPIQTVKHNPRRVKDLGPEAV